MGVVEAPFPHVVWDGRWDPGLLAEVVGEFPDAATPGWRRYSGRNEGGKLEGGEPLWGPATRQLFHDLLDPGLAAELGGLFGIDGLVGDTVGGGYHQTLPGGRLGMHVDFNRHPRSGLWRRLNLLVYLNDGWSPEWGGGLWLGAGRDLLVAPVFNRTVVFATSEVSWHGHPDPWAGPQPRRSVAVYFYSSEPPPVPAADHSTVWLEP